MRAGRQWAIARDSFPRSFLLALVAIPVTYWMASVTPISVFYLFWGAIWGGTVAGQLYNVIDVLNDVEALTDNDPSDVVFLTRTARIALRRTLAPLVLSTALGVWVFDSVMSGAILAIRPSSEWLLYYLIVVLDIAGWFDVFDKHKLLNRRMLTLQEARDGEVVSRSR